MCEKKRKEVKVNSGQVKNKTETCITTILKVVWTKILMIF